MSPIDELNDTKTLIESNKTSMSNAKNQAENRRQYLTMYGPNGSHPNESLYNDSMTIITNSISDYNNALNDYNANVTRYRTLETQINASAPGTVPAYETPTFLQLSLSDFTSPPFIPASAFKLGNYSYLMYIIYLFNNPGIKDKLNLNSSDVGRINHILKILGFNSLNNSNFNTLFTTLTAQLNRIKSTPTLQQHMKDTISSIKQSVQSSPDLHTALRTEVDKFLRELV